MLTLQKIRSHRVILNQSYIKERKCLSLKELTDRDFHHKPSLAYLHVSVTYSTLDKVSCMIKWFILSSHIFSSHSVELKSSKSGLRQHTSLQWLKILGAISETADSYP